jgi:hypothetical protein
VLVWDPIHVADVGRTSQFYERYVALQNPVTGKSVAHLYAGFLDVAEQLVKPKTGIVLVKLCDQVHNGRYRWQVYELVAEAQRRGWTACQRKIVSNSRLGRIRDQQHKRQWSQRQWPVWRTQRHFGEHKGNTLLQVARTDPDYVRRLALSAQRPQVRAAARELVVALEASEQAVQRSRARTRKVRADGR